jgi:hypothetical protein
MSAFEEVRCDLDQSLKAIFASLADQIDPKNRELLEEFVENREYGVALEWFHSLVTERNIELSLVHRLEVKRLADVMKIDLQNPK